MTQAATEITLSVAERVRDWSRQERDLAMAIRGPRVTRCPSPESSLVLPQHFAPSVLIPAPLVAEGQDDRVDDAELLASAAGHGDIGPKDRTRNQRCRGPVRSTRRNRLSRSCTGGARHPRAGGGDGLHAPVPLPAQSCRMFRMFRPRPLAPSTSSSLR